MGTNGYSATTSTTTITASNLALILIMVTARFSQLLPEANIESSTSGLERLKHFNPKWNWEESKQTEHISLETVLNDSRWLSEAVNRFYIEQNACSKKVAASLVQKRLLNCIVSPLIAVYLFCDQLPQSDIRQLFIDRKLAENIKWRDEPFSFRSNHFIQWLDQLINKLFDVFRELFVINRKVFWGNAALAIASPWSQLSRFGQGGEKVKPEIELFLAQFSAPLHNALEWLLIDIAANQVCIPRRNSCCLKFSLPSGALCGTCNRRPKEEQILLVQGKFSAL